ncbi:hypothetical protein JTE90_012317 [Oedothorax gibbosus]|uniref:Uncharacterized protein n=1 Tax=Oedothorax gibbosus TaxID=931172 RepID=A0AAV6VLF0_9ARAC|nr:hypothetical protein JTE90_012317 [Oedothorax gibbosus]
MASLSQDSMTSDIVCFICKKSLEEGFAATVKKKGIKTLLKSSIKRGRKDYTRFLKKRDIIQVHRACSKNYCDERRINVFLRQVSHQVNQVVGPVIASPQQFRIDCGNFDFIGHCFLCGESIESDYEKKQKKLPVALRNAVHLVEKKDQRDKFLEAAKIRGDEWAEKVIYRIAPYSDLVLVDAKYHHDCQKKLYQAPNLTTFPKVILKNKKGPLEKWKRTIVAISHAIIAATRPRSFVSPLLTGLSVCMYRKFGSKLLIDMMSSLGFSSSHHEAQLLEASSIAQSQPSLKIPNADAFCQLVFDNADFNVNTIDGHGTFHAMGGIACVTPFEAAGKMGKLAEWTVQPVQEPARRGNTLFIAINNFESTKHYNLKMGYCWRQKTNSAESLSLHHVPGVYES